MELLWYARLGSNQRLSAPEADALSTELRAHASFILLLHTLIFHQPGYVKPDNIGFRAKPFDF